jgi:hypothetical protein
MADRTPAAGPKRRAVPTTARIYVLIDPRDFEVRYVGMTTRPLRVRLNAHMRDRRGDNYRIRWINALRREGLRAIIAEIEEVPVEDWAKAERKWIAFYRAAGSRLVNATDGGEGILGWKPTPEQRRKIGELSRLKFQDPRQRELVSRVHKGKSISEEHRRAVGEATARRWVEYRASGGTLSDESRARLSAAAKARKPHKWTPESRAKLSVARRRAWAEQQAAGEGAAIRQRMREGIARSGKRPLTGLGTVLVDADGAIHGVSGYNYGCRCDVCQSAKVATGHLRTAREREARLSAPPRFCQDCGADISHRHLKAKYCEACGSDAKVQARRRRLQRLSQVGGG